MPKRSLDEWLAHIESLHPENIELGLERVGQVASRLGLREPRPTTIVIAGTNGKGSTSTLLEAMALAAGKTVGVYTSPHLIHYNERVRVNGTPVSDQTLVAAFEAIAAARGDTALTYFEYGTLAALRVFDSLELDLLVLEVGLGGRLDAVNIVDADLAIITSISLDHESWLGSDRESIGREKAGILRAGTPAVIADADPPASVLECLKGLACPTDFYSAQQGEALPVSRLRPENVFAAQTAAQRLGFAPDRQVLEGLLRDLVLPGRLQEVECQGLPVVLDVAHNPASVENLAAWLQRSVPGRRIALFAALSDKDIHAMIRPCSGVFEHWYVVGLPGVERALDADVLAEAVAGAGLPLAAACGSVAEAWSRILSEQAGATIVVFGSFYTVGGFMELLGEGHIKA